MLRVLKREVYLWQGILAFVVYISMLLAGGIYYTNYLTKLNAEPVSKVDLEMVATLKNIEESPKNSANYVMLGSIYLQKGSSKVAKNAFIKALSLDKNNLEAMNSLASLYIKEKNNEKAEEYLRRIIKINPELSSANFNLAKVLIEQKKFAEADKILSSLKSFETNADYYYYSGLVCEKLDRTTDAKRNYEKALQFDPQYKEAQTGLKRVLIVQSKNLK